MRIYSNKKRPVKASKDYADFTGKDFKTAKAQLEKDGYKEHEYGDTKEGNGYAVYRKGDKEVELTYEWVGTKNNAHAGKVLDVYVDEDINGACGKKSVKASTAGTIPYDLVSMLVALRDYISIDDTDYINDEHRMLVDVADSLYNAGISVDEMSPEYQAVYNKYGKDFFDLVLDDVAALDTQITANNVNDLIEDYNDREATFTGVNASTTCKRNTKAVKASSNSKRRRITAAEGSYDANMQKIQYFAQKVVADISKAAEIFSEAGISWTPIEVPDVNGDDLFYEWYCTDYIQNFDDAHNKDAEIYELRGRTVKYAVRYGYFDSNDLENYGDDKASLYEFLQSFNFMGDVYYVTTEFGHTIADLAADPYAVFDDVFGDDESDILYYSEEVLAEFDLLTYSDRVYDFAKDAQGIVNLYNKVSAYFSHTNAEQLLAEYVTGIDY